MRKVSVVLQILCLAFLCAAIVGASEDPTDLAAQESAPGTEILLGLDLANLEPNLSTGSCGEAVAPEAVELGGPITIKATCTADCGSAPDVTCTSSGTCTAVDRNCAVGEPGHVTCGSTTNYCPACQCTDGQTRYVTTSSCCCDYTIDWAPVSRRRLNFERCINGVWVYQSYSCSGQNCGGNCPL